MTISRHGLFALVSATIVAAAAIAALAVIGSPEDMRLRRLDDRRAADLTRLAGAVANYRLNYGALPQGLDYLQRLATLPRAPTEDPAGRPYELRAIDDQRYELCATFDMRTGDGAPVRPADIGSIFLNHPAGRHCFTLEAKSAPK